MWGENEFNSSFSSPGGASKEIKKNQLRHVVPITGYALQEAKAVEGEVSFFEFKHLKFHQVCLVGIIKSIVKHTNDITSLIDDMTWAGDVTVKLQAEDGEDIENEDQQHVAASQQFIENQYVRVYGILKVIGGQRILQAFKILPIKDLNEITNQVLECLNASVHYSQKSGDISAPMTSGAAPLRAAANHSNTVHHDNADGGLSGVQKQVSTIIKQCKSESGIHIKDICDYLKSTNQQKIREALEFLSNEGHIYSTVDEDHFKSAE